MDNIHLFELINAAPGIGSVRLALARGLAEWIIYLVPPGFAVAWACSGPAARRELLQMLLAVLIALFMAEIVTHAWPQPSPSALHLGTQYMLAGDDDGLPSERVTVFWSLALSALATRRFAVWAFPLLALGLLVGVSRVYLGVNLPYDILAALPDAFIAAATGRLIRKQVSPFVSRILVFYDQAVSAVGARLR